jgi:HAD superfamily hydrolase (TIGR01549 family)
MAIRAVLLDMDGTIWESPVDWAEVRRELGVPLDSRPIMEHLSALPADKRRRGERILRWYEARAVEHGALRPGAKELMAFLIQRGIKCVLVTNNSRQSAAAVLRRHGLDFDLVYTRDDGALKPDPAALLVPLAQLGIPPEEALMIGDSHLDLVAAQQAGIEAILVAPSQSSRAQFPHDARFQEIRDLWEAENVLAQRLYK